MKKFNRNIIFISIAFACLLCLVVNIASRLSADVTGNFSVVPTFHGMLEKNEIEVVYKTKQYPFMDKITEMVKLSISDLRFDKNLSLDLLKGNYCYTIGCFNTSDNLPSVVDFTADGSYSIGITTNRPFLLDSISYRFKYNGINFIGGQKLKYFFTDSIVQQPLNCEEVEEELYPDVILPYEPIRWEFVIDCGEIILAQCTCKVGCYDIINKKMLTMQEYNKRMMTIVPKE